MPLQFFTSTWISKYDDLTKKELLKVLGYIPEQKVIKDDIKLLIFKREFSRDIKMNFKVSPNPLNIDFRCNAQRKQRYIFNDDLERLTNKIDISISDNIKDILWVNKERSLIEMNDGRYLLTQVKEFNDSEIIPYENYFSTDKLELINMKMSPMTYYLYRKDTDLVKNLTIPRDLNYKYQYYYSLDELIYLRFLFSEYDKEITVKKDFVQNKNIGFDMLQKFDRVYWSHIDYKSEDRNYVLYKRTDNIYTLIKFSIRIEDNNIALKWPKIYLSDTYEDIINWCLTFEEFKQYLLST
jgi:hypothetical protein